jgi:hypothetical protein
MKKLSITGTQLREKLLENPQWLQSEQAQQYTLIEITTHANLEGLKVKRLSPNLKFCGIGLGEWEGQCASLKNCKLLETAEAYFEGNVDFSGSGLLTTKGISLNPNGVVPSKYVALFENCKNLSTAEGDWPGPISYANSGIKTIGNLTIKFPTSKESLKENLRDDRNQSLMAASFQGCMDLKIAQGDFPNMVDFSNSGIIECKNLRVNGSNPNGNSASFENCQYLNEACGEFEGAVNFSGSGISNINTEKLIIKTPNKQFMAAYFIDCQNLNWAQGKFPGGVDFSNSSVKEIKDILTPINSHVLYVDCKNLKIAKGQYSGCVNFSNSGIEKFDEENFKILNTKSNIKTQTKNTFKPTFKAPIKLILRNCKFLKEIPIIILKDLNGNVDEEDLFSQVVADKNLIDKCLEKLRIKRKIKDGTTGLIEKCLEI